jgi:hypothetical protein
VANPLDQEAEPPRSFPNVPPPDVSSGVAQARLVVKAVEDSVKELKDDVRHIRTTQQTDFKWYLSASIAGFLLLAGMFLYGYVRLEDRFEKLNDSSIRVETKLNDLLQRIPPAVMPVPKTR